MKANGLGILLGLNLAAACVALQGCKDPNCVGNTDGPVAVTVDEPKDGPDTDKPKDDEPPPAVIANDDTGTAADAGKKDDGKDASKKEVKDTTIPAVASTTPYLVRKGDILGKVARKYKLRMADILAVNPGLDQNKIRAGQVIQLPGNIEIEEEKAAPSTAANVNPPKVKKDNFKPYEGETKEYVVQDGDTLGKIAYSNGINIRQLKEMNGLKSDKIVKGRKLKVPAKPVVADKTKKETKSAMAAKAGAEQKIAEEAKKDPVKDAKGKTEAKGQPAAAAEKAAPAPVMSAPVASAPVVSAPAAPKSYTVKNDGESLIDISIDLGVDSEVLMALNGISDDQQKFKAGTVLRIPEGSYDNK